MDQSDAGSAGIFSRWTNMQTGTSASGRKAGTTGRARHGHTASVKNWSGCAPRQRWPCTRARWSRAPPPHAPCGENGRGEVRVRVRVRGGQSVLSACVQLPHRVPDARWGGGGGGGHLTHKNAREASCHGNSDTCVFCCDGVLCTSSARACSVCVCVCVWPHAP
eukprot:848387-Prorocentrum_minimum.AAC.1